MREKLKNKSSVFLLAAIAVVFLAIVAVVIWGSVAARSTTPVQQAGESSQKQNDAGKKGKIIGEEEQISVETIESGVRDMGLLITQEYYFTDAVSQSKVKTLFNIPLGFTESGYVATYDGVVTAGIDFTGVGIEIDVKTKTVTVRMPKASVRNVDIDPNSFLLYSEKNGLGNPLSISDYNGSMVELEDKARIRAVDRGLLEQADENARRIVENFIGGFLNLTKYSIEWVSE